MKSKSVLLAGILTLMISVIAFAKPAVAVDMDSPLFETPQGTIIETTKDIIFKPHDNATCIKIPSMVPVHYTLYNSGRLSRCNSAGEIAHLCIVPKEKKGRERILRAGSKLTVNSISYVREFQEIYVSVTHKNIEYINIEGAACEGGIGHDVIGGRTFPQCRKFG